MKKVKTIKGFSIYQTTEKEHEKAEKDNMTPSNFYVFLPDESPNEMCSPEFECDSLHEAIANIESY